MAGKICFDVTGWMSQRRLNMHYISLIQNPIFRSLKGALPQLPRDSRRLKWREMGSLIIEYYRQIHLRDKTPTLLFWCDQWERTSVDNRLKTEPFLLRRWVGTNGAMHNWWYIHSFCLRREAAAPKPLDYSQTNHHLTKGFPHAFHRLFHPS